MHRILCLQTRLKNKLTIIKIFLVGLLSIITCTSIYLLYAIKPGTFIRCTCFKEVSINERVARYLPSLMDEWNSLTERTVLNDAEAEHQSLPVDFLVKTEGSEQRCDLIPGLFDIHHHNNIWQEAQLGMTTLLLFSAFLDLRDEKEGPLIRILAMSNSPSFVTPTCHLFHSKNISDLPIATKAIRVDFLHWQEPAENSWHPYLITCRSENNNFPDVVSIVVDACSKSTNALKIIRGDSLIPKKNLALCHKFLFNPEKDYSKRLIEWIEASRAWGVDHITMYHQAVHPNVLKVLDYYKKQNFLTALSWTNPGTQLNIPSLLRALYDTQRYTLFTNENIPYTDCLLRNMDNHHFVGVWDMDEFIIPSTHSSIPNMINEAFIKWKIAHSDVPNALPPTSYLARTSYFFDDEIPTSVQPPEILNMTQPIIKDWPDSSFHMLSHVQRTVQFMPIGIFTKSIHDTSRALGLHSHFALYNLEGKIDRSTDLYHLYPNDEAFLAHYRPRCQGESQEICQESFIPYQIVDTTMWKHFDQIYSNAKGVLITLDLLDS